MSATGKIKWKRALSRLRFNYEELELIKEAGHECSRDFQIYYEQYCATHGIDISKLNDQHRERVNTLYNVEKAIPNEHDKREAEIDSASDTAITLHNGTSQEDNEKQEEYQMTADEIAMHEVFSKLFKRIALKIHPDKLSVDTPPSERESKLSMFQEVNKSFEQRKYYVLLDIAERLGISTPKNYSQQTRWMKKESLTVEREATKQKSTYNFMFSEAEDDAARDHLIKSFINQVFQIDIH
jgi:hypothetical protein|tara:strand:- start:577 stop:1296 length:720 start_codon:yes stop_codon:yes gene_type:complete